MQEVDPQHLGDREDPLGMAHLLHDLVLEEGRHLRRPLGSAGGAQPAPLAGERDQELLGTAPAANPREDTFPNAAVEVAGHHAVDETAPEAVTVLEALLPASLEALVEGLEQPVERRLGRPPAAVEKRLHGRGESQVACRPGICTASPS